MNGGEGETLGVPLGVPWFSVPICWQRGIARDAAASPDASLLIAVIQLIFWHDAGGGTTFQDQMENGPLDYRLEDDSQP